MSKWRLIEGETKKDGQGLSVLDIFCRFPVCSHHQTGADTVEPFISSHLVCQGIL